MLCLLAVLLLTVGSQVVFAKGAAGEYATMIAGNNYIPAKGDIIDQNGTSFNLIGDVYQRMMNRIDQVVYNNLVTVSSAGAVSITNSTYELWPGSATVSKSQVGNYFGWTIAIPTGVVTADQVKVRLYNPYTNTQKMLVNIATGSAADAWLSYPATSTFIVDLDPGENFEIEVSSYVHPVVMSSGTFSTEKVQSTLYR